MATKYKNRSLRLRNFDYGGNGVFHITICTHQMKNYFGEVVEAGKFDSEMAGRTGYCPSQNEPERSFNRTDSSPFVLLSPIGQKAKEYWLEIPKHYSYVVVDDCIFMPNHMHGILSINRAEKKKWEPNKFGIQSGNLGAIIRGYKSSLKRYANQNNIEFRWKERYWDDIINNESDLIRVRNYIHQNPIRYLQKLKNNS